MKTADALVHARKAVLEHLAKERSGAPVGKTFGHLMVACGFEKARYTDDGLPESRVLDRTLQRLRKDCILRFEKREWHLVTDGGTCPLCKAPIGSTPDCLNCAKLPEVLDAMRGGNPDSVYVHLNERKS